MASMKSEDSEIDYKPNPYGYGLTVHLNDDQCESLGVSEPLRAGSKVSIRAIAFVANITESVEMDGDDAGNDISLCLQITDMELNAAGYDDPASTLYSSGADDN